MRDHPPLLAIHAGAPFTGSLDVRRYLRVNRTAMAAQGIACAAPAIPAFGVADMPALPWPPADSELAVLTEASGAIAAALGPVAAAARSALALTVPDLLGPAGDLLQGRFFPMVGARAAALRLALGRPVDRLVLVVRPYEEMVRAAWRAVAVDGDAPDFASCARRVTAFQAGWPEVAEALAEVLGSGEINVMVAPAAAGAIMSQLLPDADLSRFADVDATPELTDSAVAMIRRHIAQGGRFAPGQRERLIAFHARQPQHDDFGPRFPELALADLRGRYVADLAMLARTPGVSLAGPAFPFALGGDSAERRMAT